MSDSTVYQNYGLFSEEKLANLNTSRAWSDDDAAEKCKRKIRLLYERTLQMLDGEASEAETQFYFIGPLFHQFGYMHSVSEPIPYSEATDETTYIDYTLFKDAESFSEIAIERGKSAFFQKSLAIVETRPFEQPFEQAEEQEEPTDNVANKVNRCLIINAIDWGMGTNGQIWRIYNRQKADQPGVFLQLDLKEALRSSEPDAWKVFWLLLRKESYLFDVELGASLLDTLLD